MNEVFLGGWVGGYAKESLFFSWLLDKELQKVGVNKGLEQGAELSRGQARYCYSVSKPQ